MAFKQSLVMALVYFISQPLFQARLFLLMMCTAGVSGFLLTSGSCIAPSPCTCSGYFVYCQGKSLSAVPKFAKSNSTDRSSHFYLYLYSNQLTTIPGQAFVNISTVNATMIDIQLQDNHISSISPDAFTGIENTTYGVYLHNNNLTSVPSALAKLRTLQYLYLQGNPIREFDPSITSLLGISLTDLRLDIDAFQSWPYAIGKLKRLTTLVINKIPFSHLTLNAFDGLESSLTSLTISLSQLLRIPSAICHLQHLQSLTFADNAMIETNFSLFEPCQHKLVHLTTLSLRGDKLKTFPDVLHSLPSIQYLYLDNNYIRYIPSKLIPYKNDLREISLGNNQLSRIPYALTRAKHVGNLRLHNNQVSTIEENDLVALSNLQFLYIYNNPIEYIAPHAFKNNSLINYINMRYTHTEKIPEAVLSLPKLRTFYFNYNNIKCDCNMGYLKRWNVTNISIGGSCAGQSISLKQYILNYLPKCP